jgi:hypothetical protein
VKLKNHGKDMTVVAYTENYISKIFEIMAVYPKAFALEFHPSPA